LRNRVIFGLCVEATDYVLAPPGLSSPDMSHRRRAGLKAAAAAFASNAINPSLRRAQLSFLGAWTAEWAFSVALGIVAYPAGGPTAVGLVGLLRMVPSAVIAPLAAPLADRGRRERVLVLVSTLRGVATGAAGIVVAVNGPVEIVYVLTALSTIAATLYRPAHSALLPSLCRTAHELASANVVRGMLDSIATLVGPLLAAVILEFTNVAVVFAVASAASLAAAAVLLRLRYDAPPRPAAPGGAHLMADVAEESLITLAAGLGALVASLLIEWTSVTAALIIVGALCPSLVLLAWLRLRHLDRYIGELDSEIGLLHGVPMFLPLPLPAIEQLARGLEPIHVPAGQAVFCQGDPADASTSSRRARRMLSETVA
jgi:MFS family permease